MQINVKTKIRYKGQEYSSVAELPAEVREIYERALSNRPGKLLSSGARVSTRVMFNGHEVDSTKELAEAEQKLYEDVKKLLEDNPRTGAKDRTLIPPQASIVPVSAPGSLALGNGWLTPNQKKLVAVVAALILIGVLVIAVRFLG